MADRAREQPVWFRVYHGPNGDEIDVASTHALALKLGVESVKMHWDEVKDRDVRYTLRNLLVDGKHGEIVGVWNTYNTDRTIEVYGPSNLVNEDFNNGNFPEESTP